MLRVNGLEFNYIFAVGANNKKLPNGVSRNSWTMFRLKSPKRKKKCLLYVALTRARAGDENDYDMIIGSKFQQPNIVSGTVN